MLPQVRTIMLLLSSPEQALYAGAVLCASALADDPQGCGLLAKAGAVGPMADLLLLQVSRSSLSSLPAGVVMKIAQAGHSSVLIEQGALPKLLAGLERCSSILAGGVGSGGGDVAPTQLEVEAVLGGAAAGGAAAAAAAAGGAAPAPAAHPGPLASQEDVAATVFYAASCLEAISWTAAGAQALVVSGAGRQLAQVLALASENDKGRRGAASAAFNTLHRTTRQQAEAFAQELLDRGAVTSLVQMLCGPEMVRDPALSALTMVCNRWPGAHAAAAAAVTAAGPSLLLRRMVEWMQSGHSPTVCRATSLLTTWCSKQLAPRCAPRELAEALLRSGALQAVLALLSPRAAAVESAFAAGAVEIMAGVPHLQPALADEEAASALLLLVQRLLSQESLQQEEDVGAQEPQMLASLLEAGQIAALRAVARLAPLCSAQLLQREAPWFLASLLQSLLGEQDPQMALMDAAAGALASLLDVAGVEATNGAVAAAAAAAAAAGEAGAAPVAAAAVAAPAAAPAQASAAAAAAAVAASSAEAAEGPAEAAPAEAAEEGASMAAGGSALAAAVGMAAEIMPDLVLELHQAPEPYVGIFYLLALLAATPTGRSHMVPFGMLPIFLILLLPTTALPQCWCALQGILSFTATREGAAAVGAVFVGVLEDEQLVWPDEECYNAWAAAEGGGHGHAVAVSSVVQLLVQLLRKEPPAAEEEEQPMVGSWQGLQRAALGTLGNLARQGQCLEELRGQAAVGALQQLTADEWRRAGPAGRGRAAGAGGGSGGSRTRAGSRCWCGQCSEPGG
jgi:hypothetical protein